MNHDHDHRAPVSGLNTVTLNGMNHVQRLLCLSYSEPSSRRHTRVPVLSLAGR
jgi:hypothetical protein